MNIKKTFQSVTDITQAMLERLDQVIDAGDDPSTDSELLSLQAMGNAMTPDAPIG